MATKLHHQIASPVAGALNDLTIIEVDGTDPTRGNLRTIGGGTASIVDGLVLTPANVTSAATIFTQDVTGYESIAVQVTNAGVGCTISYEESIDNINWIGVAGYDINNPGTSSAASGLTTTTTGIRVWNCTAKYFRARVSTYGSGTVTALAILRVIPLPTVFTYATINGVTSVSGSSGDSSPTITSPVLVAGKVRTAVDLTYVGGDAQNITTTTDMQVLTKPFGLPETDWQYSGATPITTTVAVALKAAGAASVRNYVTAIQYHNTSATASEFQILDGATVIWRGYAPASMTFPANVEFPTPLRGTAATAMNAGLAVTATNTYVNAQGYQGI